MDLVSRSDQEGPLQSNTQISADPEQSLVQTLAEAFGHFDHSFVTQQLHNIPHPVVDSGAVSAARKVVLNLTAQFRRDVVLQVLGQLPAYLITIDLYDAWFLRHEYHRSIGCGNAKKVTLAIIFARQPSCETFVTLLNPTAT